MKDTDVDIARRAYAAFARGDVNTALEHLSPQIEWRMSPAFSRAERVFHGHEGVREVFALFTEALDDFSVQLLAVYPAPGHVVASVRIGGRYSGTTESAEFDLVHVWTMQDLQATRLVVYETLEAAFEAIGMTPPPASSASIADAATGLENR